MQLWQTKFYYINNWIYNWSSHLDCVSSNHQIIIISLSFATDLLINLLFFSRWITFFILTKQFKLSNFILILNSLSYCFWLWFQYPMTYGVHSISLSSAIRLSLPWSYLPEPGRLPSSKTFLPPPQFCSEVSLPAVPSIFTLSLRAIEQTLSNSSERTIRNGCHYVHCLLKYFSRCYFI